MIKICTKVIDNNLSYLLNKLKNIEIDVDKENEKGISNEELDKELLGTFSTFQTVA